MGFLNTKLGALAKNISKSKEKDYEKEAFNQSVLNQMADLNNEQLDEGVYADGTDTPDYAPYTIEIKKAQGKIWQHMNFKDTGETRESITYIFSNGKLTIRMNDMFNLLQNYSVEIIGLTSESIDFLKPEIIENIQEKIYEQFNT